MSVCSRDWVNQMFPATPAAELNTITSDAHIDNHAFGVYRGVDSGVRKKGALVFFFRFPDGWTRVLDIFRKDKNQTAI